MKISIVTHCKYLDVIISEHNSDNDLKRQMRKFYANANMLISKFSKCSVNVKCYLFKTYCSTMYCSALWFNNTKTALPKLKIAYNNSLRKLHVLGSAGHFKTKIRSLVPFSIELLRVQLL